MGVFSKSQIEDRMAETDYTKKLLITPLLSPNQIGPASVDIRLGSSIIVPKKTYMETQDVTDPAVVKQVEERLYQRIRLKYNSKFVLHPGDLILAGGFEYITLPFDVFATVASRSSWGRLGLVIATASVVQPGFKGCLTLELANLSESAIALYPGLMVGQLVFQEVLSKGEKVVYKSRYDCPTEPELPKFFTKPSDSEMEFWGGKEQITRL